MLNNVSKRKIAALVMAGMITVSGGATTFASERAKSSKAPVNQSQFVKVDSSKMSELVKSALDGLVSLGTITQTQEDAVLKVFPGNPPQDGKGPMQGERKNPIDELVTSGTITEAQADAIQNAIKTAMDSAGKAK